MARPRLLLDLPPDLDARNPCKHHLPPPAPIWDGLGSLESDRDDVIARVRSRSRIVVSAKYDIDGLSSHRRVLALRTVRKARQPAGNGYQRVADQRNEHNRGGDPGP